MLNTGNLNLGFSPTTTLPKVTNFGNDYQKKNDFWKVTDTIGDIWNSISGQKQKQQNAREEAQIARDWSEYEAKNKYSWAVEGMKKAGLNPYLAYGNLDTNPMIGQQANSTSGGNGNLITAGVGTLNGIANIIHATGSMASSMNSRNELKQKAEAYDYANRLLNTATKIFKK